MQKFDYLSHVAPEYLEELFSQYQSNPFSLDDSWRYFFDGFAIAEQSPPVLNGNGAQAHANGVNGKDQTPTAREIADASLGAIDWSAEAKVMDIIQAYRRLGHRQALINPLSKESPHPELLQLEKFGLSQKDLHRKFQAGKWVGLGLASLEQIIDHLRSVYCGTVGVEIGHINDVAVRDWLLQRLEGERALARTLSNEDKKRIHFRLAESEGFERFLHTRYVAQKRFSIEGGESTIPGLDTLIEQSADLGVKDIVIGMAHRGRLNVLTHILGKKPEYIFTEFEGNYKVDLSEGEGDVKYHMGYSADVTTRNGKEVHLSLGFNPSHLEFINPVAEGVARAKQDAIADTTGEKVMPVLIHGDAALAGQGVCYETINFSKLTAYSTGGTVHLVINNQVGFTTSPHDSRSTLYPTDLAKMLESPIFHVNGDDPEAVVRVMQLCAEFRQKFKSDIFVDIVCYRKYGHNEGDEPSFTQPLMYKTIKEHPSPREGYENRLVETGIISKDEAVGVVKSIQDGYTAAQKIAKEKAPHPAVSAFSGRWKGFKKPTEAELFKDSKTALSEKEMKATAKAINQFPQEFHLHSKLSRFFEARLHAIESGEKIDWGNGEILAYASLLKEGIPVRILGQDAERGTFTHRHAIVYDSETGKSYSPLQEYAKDTKFTIHNSLLSEAAALGFEYGYSIANPQALVVWEAQFGDFANGAQVIIDQFICSSESKWNRMSGLVLLLPHGYEGQGPEHSSARLERFLQLCGKLNMQVANLTTPAQIFHALRRQVHRDYRKPLVIMSPKSLLRNPQAVSTLDEFTNGSFQEVLDDPKSKSLKKVKRVVLCSGKVFYELNDQRESSKNTSTAIVRIEQLYPWPKQKLAKILKAYPGAELVWVQEEPKNMGSWSYIRMIWDEYSKEVENRQIQYVGREICAAPAVGSTKVHVETQKAILEQAL